MIGIFESGKRGQSVRVAVEKAGMVTVIILGRRGNGGESNTSRIDSVME